MTWTLLDDLLEGGQFFVRVNNKTYDEPWLIILHGWPIESCLLLADNLNITKIDISRTKLRKILNERNI